MRPMSRFMSTMGKANWKKSDNASATWGYDDFSIVARSTPCRFGGCDVLVRDVLVRFGACCVVLCCVRRQVVRRARRGALRLRLWRSAGAAVGCGGKSEAGKARPFFHLTPPPSSCDPALTAERVVEHRQRAVADVGELARAARLVRLRPEQCKVRQGKPKRRQREERQVVAAVARDLPCRFWAFSGVVCGFCCQSGRVVACLGCFVAAVVGLWEGGEVT